MKKDKTFKIRDERGQIFNTVARPTIVADLEDGVRLKMGEYEDMEKYFRIATNAYFDNNAPQMAQALALIELPKDQSTIDKMFQITGYVKVFYDNLIKETLKPKQYDI